MIAIEGLTAGYGKTTVIDDVAFTVSRGQVLALLGPNGAGKTTTLRALTGLIRAQAGRVEIDGADITAWAPHRRARAGLCLIPEGRGVFRTLTVRQNLRVQVAGGDGGRHDEGVERALQIFPDLGKCVDRLAGQLSGGQQQMLALARAYLTDPKIVLLDEPSMGLAPRVVDVIFDALVVLADSGVAVILVEQYVTRAMEMADKVVLLRKGVVAFEGPPSELDEERILRGYLGVELPATARG